MPRMDTYDFFPRTLTRKQYVIRWLIMAAVVLVAMFAYFGAPTGTAVQIAVVVFVLCALAAFLYNILGYRFRDCAAPGYPSGRSCCCSFRLGHSSCLSFAPSPGRRFDVRAGPWELLKLIG